MVHPQQHNMRGGGRKVSDSDLRDWGLEDLIGFPCHFGPAGWPYEKDQKREYDDDGAYHMVDVEASRDKKRSKARENGRFHKDLHERANRQLRSMINKCKNRPQEFSIEKANQVRCHPPQHA